MVEIWATRPLITVHHSLPFAELHSIFIRQYLTGNWTRPYMQLITVQHRIPSPFVVANM